MGIYVRIRADRRLGEGRDASGRAGGFVSGKTEKFHVLFHILI